MALRTWASGSSTDFNSGSNYSPAGTILSTDDLFFTGLSIIDATATANFSVNSIIADSSYTGALSFDNISGVLNGDRSGFSLYLSGSGNRQLGASLSFIGNSTSAFFGDGTNTFTTTNCLITWNGTDGTWTDNKGIQTGNLRMSDGASLNLTGTAKTVFNKFDDERVLRLGANSRLTLNAPVQFLINQTSGTANYIDYAWDTTAPYTLNGSSDFEINLHDQNAPRMRCPGLIYSGTGDCTILIGQDIIYVVEFTGPLSFGGSLHFLGDFANRQAGIQLDCSSITFPNNDSTFSINDYSGETSFNSYNGTYCSLIFNGQRCAFRDNNNKGVDPGTPFKTFNKLILGANAQVTVDGSYSTIFQSVETPLILGTSSNLILNTPLKLHVADSSAAYSLGSGANITIGANGGLNVAPFSCYGGYQYPRGGISATLTEGSTIKDYFVDINSDYTSTGAGTEISPYNFTQFTTYASPTCETFRLRGSRTVGSFQWDIAGGVYHTGPYIKAWNLALYGPWRLRGTSTFSLHGFGSIEDGIISTAFNPFLGAIRFANCIIMTEVFRTIICGFGAIAYNQAYFDGCTLIGGSFRVGDPSTDIAGYVAMQDCIVEPPAISSNMRLSANNCVFSKTSINNFDSTITNSQFSWTAPTWPAWDASKELFDKSLLNYSTMTTPPRPGVSSNYAGFKNNPWTYKTNLWGGTRNDIGAYYDSSAVTWNSPLTVPVPGLTLSDSSGFFQITDYGRHSDSTIVQTGNLNLGSTRCEIYATHDNGVLKYFGNHDLTCSTLLPGTDANYGSFDLYWRLGNNRITSYAGSAHNATGNFTSYFQKSKWDCSGNWIFGSNHSNNYIPGNSHLTITGPAAIISNSRFFNFLELNIAGSGNPLYPIDTTAANYYANLDLTGTGGTGSISDPWYADTFRSAVNLTLAGGSTIKIKGIHTYSSVFTLWSPSGGYIFKSWDSTSPWRISAGGMQIRGGRNIISNGILNSTGSYIEMYDAAEFYSCFIQTIQSMVFYGTGYGGSGGISDIKGCTIFQYGQMYPQGAGATLNIYDSIINASQIRTFAGASLNTANCVINAVIFDGSHQNYQTGWTAPTWPAWNASKEFFCKEALNFYSIKSPPNPGIGYPDYTGYPANLWGNVRDDIGISYSPVGPTMNIADDLKCHGYKKVIGTLNANGKRFDITGDFQSTTSY